MRRSLILGAVLALVLSAAAFGAVQDFGKFTLDVPAGWTAEKDGETVGIVKNDKSVSVSITVDSTDGMALKDLAEAFVEALKGKDLKEEKGSYTFTMTSDSGVKSEAFLSGEDGQYCLIVVTGGENAPEEVVAIMDSLTEKK